MRFGIVGLGRMGMNLAQQALEKGHQVHGYDPNPAAIRALADAGLIPASSLGDLVSGLLAPRLVLLYVPHGEPTERVCTELLSLLAAEDAVVDGGNSDWRDSFRRHALFAQASIGFLDVGTSGGVSGARNGASFMAGGDRAVFDRAAPLLHDLAVDDEAVYLVGPPGSGHFAKLVHNAIEFGMIQAIAEGVELLERWEYDLNLPALFNHWMHGSVIRSWLIELMGKGLAETPDVQDLSTFVEDTGEVKWVLEWAMRRDIPMPVVSAAQTALMQYRDLDSPSAKAVALLRHQFGGHPVLRPSRGRPARR